ncbi:UDP-glucose 4-epimerase GalE [Sutcliffiella cohnii]|uniref:UDP-glucose 4-epimerase n=1 Tax=Sutcliffiella cohnii TaxID=33932 RepID=A0A223KX90_9BACI|nr:UDP-glucose 4-epimerase GalE [Sutcliffiella cohnii]AST94080.1 UDP-glucose 4-epimerase GalE [Sutcliffiella cohnii]
MILVVGGAGYIGSHTVKSLLDHKYDVVVLDNLSTGHIEAVDKRAIFTKGDMKDTNLLTNIFENYSISNVIHFAANCYVGESITEPLKYYENNVAGTISLLKMMRKHQITNLIFSSTCAVYGNPNIEKINESTLTAPINPYGHSKLMIEQIIKDFSIAYRLNYIILRYFNAAGADHFGRIGEDHQPETHLIPNILFHLLGRSEHISVFGDDYDTVDGTCIRDYIHVTDLVNAHILALEGLKKEKAINKIYNVGNEEGFTVKEVINKCEKVTGKEATILYKQKRKGDPSKLISSSEKISKELGWEPKYSLEDMIETAWKWFSRFPKGYKSK